MAIPMATQINPAFSEATRLDTTLDSKQAAVPAADALHPLAVVQQVTQKIKQDLRMGREHQQGRINWITTIFMGLFHVGAIAALFFFSWKNLATFFIMYFFAINVGIGMAYHRLLTHRGYKTPKWLEYFVTACGCLALEGGTDLLGRHASRASPELRSRGRPAHAARWHLVGPCRLDSLRSRAAL